MTEFLVELVWVRNQKFKIGYDYNDFNCGFYEGFTVGEPKDEYFLSSKTLKKYGYMGLYKVQTSIKK